MSERLARLFVNAPLRAGRQLSLDAGQSHYLRHVLRCGPGDSLLLFNGQDGEWRAIIEGGGKGSCAAVVTEAVRSQALEPDLWLLFAPIKRAGIDFVAEKATELGVSTLWPVITRRTVVTRVNLERLEAQAREAAEQCERLSVPTVKAPADLTAVLAAWSGERRLWFLDERGDCPPIAEAMSRAHTGPAAILAGPEGGFASSELDLLRNLPFANAVGLGPRILRAETAALAALACWQALLGDWRGRPAP